MIVKPSPNQHHIYAHADAELNLLPRTSFVHPHGPNNADGQQCAKKLCDLWCHHVTDTKQTLTPVSVLVSTDTTAAQRITSGAMQTMHCLR